MPKNLVIDPNFIRAKGSINFTDIPVNVYDKTIADEKKNFKKADFVRIFNDIAMLREFESMINEIKIKGEYQGFKHSYPGPAHLSMGQEAAAVGQAYILDMDDMTFGSHRSHSEVLARGLASINKLDDANFFCSGDSDSGRITIPSRRIPPCQSKTNLQFFPAFIYTAGPLLHCQTLALEAPVAS